MIVNTILIHNRKCFITIMWITILVRKRRNKIFTLLNVIN